MDNKKQYEEAVKSGLFPDEFIGWVITSIDDCDDHMVDFDNLLNVKYWIDRKTLLQEVRNKYQTLILDKKGK